MKQTSDTDYDKSGRKHDFSDEGRSLLLQRVRPLGGPCVDVLVSAGMIQRMEPGIAVDPAMVEIYDGQDHLLLPGLVNAHAHVDSYNFV